MVAWKAYLFVGTVPPGFRGLQRFRGCFICVNCVPRKGILQQLPGSGLTGFHLYLAQRRALDWKSVIVVELLQPGADTSRANLGMVPGFDIKCKLFGSYLAVLADLELDAFPYAVG